MAWINIQGTRAGKTKQAPQGREKYLSAISDQISQTPWYVGSILLALAMYVKTTLASYQNGKEAAEDLRQPDEPQLQPSNEGPLSATEEVSKEFATLEEPEQGAVVLHPMFASRFYSESFNIMPASIDFERLNFSIPNVNSSLGPMMTTGAPVKFPVLPSNDNRTGAPSTANLAPGTEGVGDEIAEEDESQDDDDTDSQIQNRRPAVSRPVVLYDQFMCTAVAISFADLLSGAVDPDGDQLQVRNATVSSGELVRTENGFLFTGHEYGKVTISYTINDASLGVMQTASFNIIDRPPVVGTESADNLVGTDCDDKIFGLDGRDQIDGRDGDDHIHGGEGDDHIFGGAGDDVIFGEGGNDVLVGGLGNDTLMGGDGNDRLFGGEGNDVLVGGSGDDQLFDGAGNDHVDGEEGNDHIFAEADQNPDLFNGGTGVDTLDYGLSATALRFNVMAGTVTDVNFVVDQFAGMERLAGGSADDIFVGGPDLQVAGPDADQQQIASVSALEDEGTAAEPVVALTQEEAVPALSIDGGAGFDTLDYSAARADLRFDMVHETVAGEEIGTVAVRNIESFVGGEGNDSFIVGFGEVVLDGRGGNDVFEFLTDTTLESSSGSYHQIVGFEAGDRVRMSRYDIFEDAIDELQDTFEDIYGDESGPGSGDDNVDQVVPIRVRHEINDTVQRTYIEADFDRDDTFELSVELEGNVNLVVVNNHTA